MKGAEKQFWQSMVVLSLFDGISCGRVALEKAGKQIETYFASEIDKYSEKVAKMNYPDTVEIGDVTKVSYIDGILYTGNGNYEVPKIDMVIGGSPCQGFSNAADFSRRHHIIQKWKIE